MGGGGPLDSDVFAPDVPFHPLVCKETSILRDSYTPHTLTRAQAHALAHTLNLDFNCFLSERKYCRRVVSNALYVYNGVILFALTPPPPQKKQKTKLAN